MEPIFRHKIKGELNMEMHDRGPFSPEEWKALRDYNLRQRQAEARRRLSNTGLTSSEYYPSFKFKRLPQTQK